MNNKFGHHAHFDVETAYILLFSSILGYLWVGCVSVYIWNKPVATRLMFVAFIRFISYNFNQAGSSFDLVRSIAKLLLSFNQETVSLEVALDTKYGTQIICDCKLYLCK